MTRPPMPSDGAARVGPIRVLIADDSPTLRKILATLLAEDPGILVAGEATDGVEAVELARSLRPDIITMDVKMPRLDGLEAIRQIMSLAPCRILVVCAADDERQVDLSFRATSLGALEFIAKPRGAQARDLRAWGRKVAESVRLMSEIPVVRRHFPDAPVPQALRGEHGRVDALGIVASTGGPPAIASILASLPADLRVPVFIAQHMARGFGSGLVRWLSSVTPLKVVTAADGTPSRPGHVYLANDGCDLVVDAGRRVRSPASDSPHCPSGDRLLLSLAAAFGVRAAGLILTGMGVDGSEGVRALRRAGGVALAQEEAGCVVFGMPKSALLAGALPISLGAIASTLRDLSTVSGNPIS